MTKSISNDDRIDGLLTTVDGLTNPVLSWQTTNELGTAVTLDISFLDNATNSVSGFEEMNTDLQAATMTALQHFSDVANLTFNVVDAGDGDLNFGTAALHVSGLSFTAGTAYYGYSYNSTFARITNANVYLTNAVGGYDDADVGDASYTTLLHEIAHALGLEHPFEDTLVPAGTDSDQYTVMSYTSYYPYGTNPASLMLYDMMTIQYLYGANHSFNSGDTVIDIDAFLNDGPRALWDGAGEDTIDLSNLSSGKTFDLNEGSFNTINDTNDFVIAFGAAIENLTGTDYNDDLTGTDSANLIMGGSGNDTIDAGKGKDEVHAGAGDDEIYLGKGKDLVKAGGGQEDFFGGNGNDTISYYDSTGGVTLDLQSDTASGSWADDDTFTNFESANGSDIGGDVLYGTGGSNKLKGNGGADELYGREDADKLYGGKGTDSLVGGKGSDKLWGGKGEDTLHGGKGDDILHGEGGADVFLFNDGDGNDTITDFEDNTDLIEFGEFAFSDADDALLKASQSGSDVVFNFDDGSSLTVENATLGQIENDIAIV